MNFNDERTYIICGNIITDNHKSILRLLNPSDQENERILVSVEVVASIQREIEIYKGRKKNLNFNVNVEDALISSVEKLNNKRT